METGISNSAFSSSAVEKWGITEHQTIIVTFKWVIKKFSFCTKKNGEFLISPQFTPENHENLVWNLQLYPKGQDQESKDHLSIYLNLVPRSPVEVHAKYQFAILNKNGDMMDTINGNRHCFSKDSLGWGRRKFVEQAVLFDERNGLLPDDSLTIHCKVEIAAETVHFSGHSKMSMSFDPALSLMDDMAELFKRHSYADVTFVVNKVEFPAHKAIITSRCPVFAAMFQHEMQERRTNRVAISDVNPQIFKELLRYIYTSKVEGLDHVAEEMLSVSDKYCLQPLKNMCEAKMWSQLSMENSVKFLILADLHTAHHLKGAAINYINRNAKEVVKTEDWKALEKSHPHLFIDLYLKNLPSC